jgi:hypothetical protein
LRADGTCHRPARRATAPAGYVPPLPPDYRRLACRSGGSGLRGGILADHLLEPDLQVWLIAAAVLLAAWGISLRVRIGG